MTEETDALLAASIGRILWGQPRFRAVFGVGFMRVRLHAWPDLLYGNGAYEIHVWDPSFHAEDMDDSGMIHDHRFNLRSVVLLGAIHDTEIVSLLPTDEDGDGLYQIHEVDPPPSRAVRALPQHYRLEPSEHTYAAGATYRYPRHKFHRSEVHELTVTLCTVRGALNGGGRLLARAGRTPVHIGDGWGRNLFGLTHCRTLLNRAAEQLLERARL